MRAGIADQKPAWREGLALGQTDAHDSHQNLWVHPPTPDPAGLGDAWHCGSLRQLVLLLAWELGAGLLVIWCASTNGTHEYHLIVHRSALEHSIKCK